MSASPKRLRLAVLLATVLAVPGAAPAAASPGQETIIMDDSRLVYGEESGVNDALDKMKALGADRLRVSVFWSLVAPNPESRTRPRFDAANPAAYPASRWDRYDKLVTQARARGLDLMLNVTSPAPLWATGTPGREDIADTFRPDPAEFARFVAAVARRYDGTYLDESHPPDQPGIFGIGGTRVQGPVLPRVSMWSIWNEPNQAGWLTPQWVRQDGGWQAAAPRTYRALWDEAWVAFHAAGHGDDTILLGETAPKGLRLKGEARSMRPLVFLRELYCVDRRLRPFSGGQASARGCPGNRAGFVREHPGLFATTGFGHHPYGLLGPPDQPSPAADDVALADLPRLGSTLDRIFRAYGNRRRLPLYLTEYGYQTDPPDPTIGVPLRAHARYLDQGEFIAYANPRVRAQTQFLLYDDGPLKAFRLSDPRYWGSWQGGLLFANGEPKPAFATYPLPVWVPVTEGPKGKRLRIWGQLRSAPNETPQVYSLQFKPAGGGRFKLLKRQATSNPRGYFNVNFRISGSGKVRIAWKSPTGAILVSRETLLRVR